ncbi:MAG: hypothetical protein WCK64_04025 [Synechococcaceae cyanobacterium ELA445]
MKPEIAFSNDIQTILGSEQSSDPLGWSAFLEELEVQVAVDRANDPGGMATLEAQWVADAEARRAQDDKRSKENEQRTRELGRLRVARFRARKKAKENALHNRQQMDSFVESWKVLSYQQQEESVEVFRLILESMTEEIKRLEEESILVRWRPRGPERPVYERPVPVIRRSLVS